MHGLHKQEIYDTRLLQMSYVKSTLAIAHLTSSTVDTRYCVAQYNTVLDIG